MLNDLGQPVGEPLPGWTPPPAPTADVLEGEWCRLERLDPDRHADDLFAADRADTDGASWTYLPYGPFATIGDYRAWLDPVAAAEDPRFYAVLDTDPLARAQSAGRAVGVLSLMRIQPAAGSIEVGHVHLSPWLQRRRGATQAQHLLMSQAFGLGYRRYEWKCNALNAPSIRAAERLGFTFEGTFRQAQVVRGRNRDTSWYSILDREWPQVDARLRAWLAPENFDDQGRQHTALTAG